MTTINAARALTRKRLRPLPSRQALLAENIGATLAEPLRTAKALPAVDVSAMDGYAVSGAGPWILRPDIQMAGTAMAAPLGRGQAIRIATGAPVPQGATMVLRDEYVAATTVGGKTAVAHRSGMPIRDDTRQCGENWTQGAELAPPGQRVSLALVSAAFAAETRATKIRGPLRAKIILTGDEIKPDGELLRGETRDSLGPVLPHYLRALDIDCIRLVHVADHTDQIHDLLAHECDADTVFVVGATRHGPADYLRPALHRLKADTVIDGLQCRPAGTQIVAKIPGGPVIHCLPGNPYAALAALLILAPAIVDALTGRTPRPRQLIRVPGSTKLTVGAATRVLPAAIAADGSWRIDEKVRTPHLAGLIGRDALALVPPRSDPTQAIEIINLPQ